MKMDKELQYLFEQIREGASLPVSEKKLLCRRLALLVFEVQEAADAWLRSPSLPLGDRVPLDLLENDPDGLWLVAKELNAIIYGLPV